MVSRKDIIRHEYLHLKVREYEILKAEYESGALNKEQYIQELRTLSKILDWDLMKCEFGEKFVVGE